MSKPIYCPPFTPVVDYLPAQETDEWEIEHFETDEKETKDRALMSVFSDTYELYYDLKPGKYVRLTDKQATFSGTVMTDTPMERRTNLEIVERAHGDVLIAGLGLGMIIVPIMAKPEVKTVTVVEISQSLIDLVGPHLEKLPGIKKLMLVTSDVMEFWPKSSSRWNVVYFDIWPEMNVDNLDQMSFLHRRWPHRMDKSDPDRWLGSWQQDFLRRERDRSWW